MKFLLDEWSLWRSNLERLRKRNDAGASAIEWVIITAVLVIAVSVVGGIVMNIVRDKSDQMADCADSASQGDSCDSFSAF